VADETTKYDQKTVQAQQLLEAEQRLLEAQTKYQAANLERLENKNLMSGVEAAIKNIEKHQTIIGKMLDGIKT